ncbi:hypothetical protein GCM10017557_50990 [Streptomyces aurantiacus]|uniref:Uncharacterized protein n=1 Tax=Streptomyces aurantiacus TaxID=47760 RepID=A0A7G1P8X0_9ACTN|nr:hypothetical protein GCM10017557_50990 [Streptomyces aurantiacus]
MSGEIPNPLEWHLASDQELEESWENFAGLQEKARPVFLCPACGRIWVYWNGYEGPRVSYLRARVSKEIGNPSSGFVEGVSYVSVLDLPAQDIEIGIADGVDVSALHEGLFRVLAYGNPDKIPRMSNM